MPISSPTPKPASLNSFAAEADDDIILMRHEEPEARLAPFKRRPSDGERKALLDALHGTGKRDFGHDAAHVCDWLYDDDGLPALSSAIRTRSPELPSSSSGEHAYADPVDRLARCRVHHASSTRRPP